MNFQEKLLATTQELRARAAALASAAVDSARVRAEASGIRVETLRKSLTALSAAGRDLNKVARRHAKRFVEENASLVAAAGKDVSSIARATYASVNRPAKSDRRKTARRRPAARKRAAA